jgi:hypothetical protein
MPTSFRNLVIDKSSSIASAESNLEKGRIWMFAEPNVRTKQFACVCWTAPSSGQVILEVWGAGGSGAMIACCGGGIPGNPGSYSKKTFNVVTGCTVTGCIGLSCGNPTTSCFRGCSEPTGVCYQSTAGNSCICAQGGRGGVSWCSTGTSMFCCFFNAGYCGTLINSNCGIICNYGAGATIASCCAQAYGGDVNCYGGFSCTGFFGCVPNCSCSSTYFVRTPAGYMSKSGGVLVFATENTNEFANNSGQGIHQYLNALNASSRHPHNGLPHESNCYANAFGCGCYQAHGCVSFFPPGFPGMAPSPCASVCDYATRGGSGAIRIKFIAS